MVERESSAPAGRNVGLLAGVGLAAAGAATAAFIGATSWRKRRADKGLEPNSELDVGRGDRNGPVDPKALKAGYELEDTNVRLLAIIMVVSVSIMVVGVIGVYFMFDGFNSHFSAQSKSDTAQQREAIMPPLPHLQAEPYREIDATIMEQQTRLTTYGYARPEQKAAHIPIERAMQQVVGKPLDGAAQADASGAPATTQPMPSLPAFNAADKQDKPANRVQGEGRPGSVAPSFDPAKHKPADAK